MKYAEPPTTSALEMLLAICIYVSLMKYTEPYEN